MSPRLLRLMPWLCGLLLVAPLGVGLLQADVYVGNGTDLVSYQVPLRAMVAAALRDGYWPVWNPFELAGVAAHAGVQLGLAYPPDLIAPWIAGSKATELLVVLHLIWLAVGMAFLARLHLTGQTPGSGWRERLPSWLAAAVVVGSGPTWGHVYAGHVSLVQAWAWLPWLWALLLQALQTRSPWPAWLAVAAFAAQVLAGHPQTSYIGLFGLGTLLLGHALAPLQPVAADAVAWRRWPGSAVAIVLLLAVGVGAVWLAAAQWLPTWAVQTESNRNLASAEDIAFAFSAPARSLVTALAPMAWGGTRTQLAEFAYHETLAFVGAAGLALALLGAVVGGLRAWIAAAGVVTCVVLSLGNEGPLLPALLDVVPGIGSFRVPGRWLLPAVVLLALLAAQGLGWLLHPPSAKPGVAERRLARVAAGVCLAGALLCWAIGAGCRVDGGWWLQAVRDHAAKGAAADPRVLADIAAATSTALTLAALAGTAAATACWWPGLRQIVGLGLACLAAATAFWFGNLHTERSFHRSAKELTWSPQEVTTLQQQVGNRHRLATAAPLRQANWGATAGIRVAGAYEPGVSVLANRYGNLMAGRSLDAYAVNFQVRRPSAWLNRLATSHLLLASADADTTRAFAGWPQVTRFDSGRTLLRNPAPLDRISVPGHVVVQADARAAVAQLATTPVDTVVLSAPLDHAEATPAVLAVEDDSPTRLAVSVSAERGVVVVVRDALAAGWTAQVDDRPAATALCDGLFRAAAVPAGKHRLVWSYAAPGLRTGLIASLLGWLAWLGVAWRLRRRSPR